jgi:hypothetical protein
MGSRVETRRFQSYGSTTFNLYSPRLVGLVGRDEEHAAAAHNLALQRLVGGGVGRGGEGQLHKHEHRSDEDEMKAPHWFTHTRLTNGRHAKLHTTLPAAAAAEAAASAAALGSMSACATLPLAGTADVAAGDRRVDVGWCAGSRLPRVPAPTVAVQVAFEKAKL